jgi:HK97 family phage prohead protease
MILTFSASITAADEQGRMISGKIAPYGEVGYTSAGKVVFKYGSIKVADASRVKLLMAHDSSKVVGRMRTYEMDEQGMYASFSVSRSTAGSDAILLAQEQLMDGLSVGVEVTASEPKDGYLLVTAANLREVSLVESAAFASAAVQSISAQAELVEVEASTSTKVSTTVTHIESTTTETETETESEAAVTTAPENPSEDNAEEAATPVVEAARKIILPSALNSQTVRTPITSMGAYTEHKIKAALGNDESRLYVTAADDSFSTNPAFNPTQYLSEFPTNTRFGTCN